MKTITNEEEKEITASFLDSLDRNEIRGIGEKITIEWVNRTLTNHAIMCGVLEGHMEVGPPDKGEPTFRITQAGKDHVERMLRKGS